MNCGTKEITKYFRSAVAVQANMGIEFKKDKYYEVSLQELAAGKIDLAISNNVFEDDRRSKFSNKNEKKSNLNIIICAKTIKINFDSNKKTQDEIGELTGVFYIPAILNINGTLFYDSDNKKLPWFPREYLQPMLEPKLAVGFSDEVDNFMSSHVGQIEKMKKWQDYTAFFEEFYEQITESKFKDNTIRNMDNKEPFFELEDKIYIFIDKTVYCTYHILNLYNHLLKDDSTKPLYEKFMSIEATDINPLIENNLSNMKLHCGQMGGEYGLSPSQREAVNHFNHMENGEILAVNGPPGTGKTTLLQSIVSDMYVKRAISKGKPPIIVASSTNNQAVTNIIESFGNIKKMGILNLEERWINGVNSFATYFPSKVKISEAKGKKYQFTNSNKEFFINDVDNDDNIETSKYKLLKMCNSYFKSEYKNINSCQAKLHNELLFFENVKSHILSLVKETSRYDFNGRNINEYIQNLKDEVLKNKKCASRIKKRAMEFEEYYKKIPFFYKLLKFINVFAKRVQTEIRLFINSDEQEFINEYMSFQHIKEVYSNEYAKYNKIASQLEKEERELERIKYEYDNALKKLKEHNIILHEKEDEKYNLGVDFVNELLDKKVRYIEFWMAVHYFECRWLSGEDKISDNQKKTNYEDVLNKFYSRLSMLTPCLVMTFYILPKQFLAYDGQKQFFLYNYIDLLIVDEAGQVSPEIASGAFALAKRAVVVGDIYQIEPVWVLNRALDKSLALSNRAIRNLNEFTLLEKSGLNASSSSVMMIAAKCCKYKKFDERGLFLSEHRRCYNEIINYCNQLVYKGNLDPMRGNGKDDEKIAIKQWPQMGFRQVDTELSIRKGSSRLNLNEAKQIAEWLQNNFKFIVDAYSDDPQENLVGIITPFKAQVSCIEKELKKLMPSNCSKISVGTVHTFQGAERKIIILSTVYGKQDGCFFIDKRESLMNVAVSRAKDNFFVFGDINCLKDNDKSASGLLKKCIKKNKI